MARGSRRRKGGHHDEHPDERWLLTYADMITLLVALFIVLWSISAVNNSKLNILKQTLQDAFDGALVSGGKSAFESAAASDATQPNPVAPTITAVGEAEEKADGKLRGQAKEDAKLEALKRRIDAAARERGLSREVRTEVTARGLRIRLLTDRLLFDSGEAVLKAPGTRLLDAMAPVLRGADSRPVQVDGHTDSVPLSGGRYEDNWLLSSARASAVVRRLATDGISPRRLAAGGFADNKPLASNVTATGRALNRRVEILLARTDTP